MKKLLAFLLLLAVPAFAGTVTLSPNQSATVTCVDVGVVTPVPPVTPPVVPTPPPISVNYPGPDMWQYATRRMSTGDLQKGQKKTGGFTVPSGNAGQTVELGISGANLTVFVDGLYYMGPFIATTGNHLLEAQAVSGSANGSIDVYHY